MRKLLTFDEAMSKARELFYDLGNLRAGEMTYSEERQYEELLEQVFENCFRTCVRETSGGAASWAYFARELVHIIDED